MDTTTSIADPLIPVVRTSNLAIRRHIWTDWSIKANTTLAWSNGTYTCVGHTCDVCLHTECLRRHPISECSASTPDIRRRPGTASGPLAPVLQPVGSGPLPARSSSIPKPSGKPQSVPLSRPPSNSPSIPLSFNLNPFLYPGGQSLLFWNFSLKIIWGDAFSQISFSKKKKTNFLEMGFGRLFCSERTVTVLLGSRTCFRPFFCSNLFCILSLRLPLCPTRTRHSQLEK